MYITLETDYAVRIVAYLPLQGSADSRSSSGKTGQTVAFYGKDPAQALGRVGW